MLSEGEFSQQPEHTDKRTSLRWKRNRFSVGAVAPGSVATSFEGYQYALRNSGQRFNFSCKLLVRRSGFWIRDYRSFLKFTVAIALIFLVFIQFIHHASAQQNTIIDDELYAKLMKQGRYKEAYSVISRSSDRERLLIVAQHLMFGTGVIQDECKAVAILEKLTIPGPGFDRAKAILNVIYGGNWAALASQEGSPQALFHLGLYYQSIPDNMRVKALDRSSYYDKKAFRYFYLSDKYGYSHANKYLKNIEIPPISNQINGLDLSFTPVEVICPVRD